MIRPGGMLLYRCSRDCMARAFQVRMAYALGVAESPMLAIVGLLSGFGILHPSIRITHVNRFVRGFSTDVRDIGSQVRCVECAHFHGRGRPCGPEHCTQPDNCKHRVLP